MLYSSKALFQSPCCCLTYPRAKCNAPLCASPSIKRLRRSSASSYCLWRTSDTAFANDAEQGLRTPFPRCSRCSAASSSEDAPAVRRSFSEAGVKVTALPRIFSVVVRLEVDAPPAIHAIKRLQSTGASAARAGVNKAATARDQRMNLLRTAKLQLLVCRTRLPDSNIEAPGNLWKVT